MTETAINGLNDPALMAHLLKTQREHDKECEKLAAAAKAATKARKGWRKSMSGAYGFKLENFDKVFDQFMDEEAAAREVENLREQRRLAELAGLPLFASIKLPGDKAAAKPIGPFEYGNRAFLDNKNESENPHPAGSIAGQEWMKGWRTAQERCKEGAETAKRLDEQMAAAEAEKAKKKAERAAKKAARTIQ